MSPVPRPSRRFAAVMALCTLAAASLAACGSDEPSASSSGATADAAEPAAAESTGEATGSADEAEEVDEAEEAGPLVLVDQRGVSIELDEPADRIATTIIPAASMIVSISQDPGVLVGMNSASFPSIEGRLLGQLFPSLLDVEADLADMSFVPNVETIVGLDPDLVLQWAHMGNDILAPLENAGLDVAGMIYGTQEDLEFWMQFIADAVGDPERGEAMVAWHHEVRAEVEARTEAAGDSRPSVLSLQRSADQYRAVGSGNYHPWVIELAGGVNVAAELQGMQEVNAEQIVAWAPEVILIDNFDTATPADLYARPELADVPAIANRRVYQYPVGGFYFGPPSQDSPLAWLWVSMILHPEAGDVDLRQRMVEAFEFLYGQTVTDDQLDMVLNTEHNSVSSGYDVFVRG